MGDEIISLKECRPPPTERHTEDHQQNKRSDHMGRREAQWSEFAAGRRKICSHTRNSEPKPIPVIYNRYELFNNCYISEYANIPIAHTSDDREPAVRPNRHADRHLAGPPRDKRDRHPHHFSRQNPNQHPYSNRA